MKIRGRATIGSLIVGAIFIILAVVMTLVNNELLFKREVTDLNKLLSQGSVSSNIGSMVTVKVDAVLDNFAETTHTRNGFTTGKDQHFVIWLDDDSMIAVSVNKKDEIDALERIMDETWDYIEEKANDFTKQPVELRGKLSEMSVAIRGYYKDSLTRMGATSDTYTLYYYTIDCTESALLSGIIIVFLFVLGFSNVISFIITKRRQRAASVSMFAGDEGSSWDSDPME